MRLKKDDTVIIIRGKDKGKKGKVEKVLPKLGKLTVANLNIYKKHVKSRQGQKGGIIEINKPLAVFQVKLVCPSCNKPTRVGFEVSKGTKERICKKCGAVLNRKKK